MSKLITKMKEIINKQDELEFFIETIKKELDEVIDLGVEENRELYDLLWSQYIALNKDWDKLKEEFDTKYALVMEI